MSLLSLPNELLGCICKYLVYSDDINALSQSCRLLYSTINPLLFPPRAKQCQLDAITYALETGDHLLMERLGKAGIDVFKAYLNATRDELLSVAIKKGHLGVVQVLVDLNKDSMHKVTGFGHLPFTSALLLGHLEIARFLVFRGADPEFLGSNRCRRRGAGDNAGKTALSYTAKNGPLESVRFLVEETSSDLEVRGVPHWLDSSFICSVIWALGSSKIIDPGG